MSRRAATTLKDVAKEVGVSAMTVSAVLHGANSTVRVSERTRVRVIEAARRLQYRPNAVARALSKRRMNTVGVVTLFGAYGRFNLVAHEILSGIIDAASQWEQYATFCQIDAWDDDERRVFGLCDGRLDGLILLSPTLSDDFAERLSALTDYISIHSPTPPQHGYNIDVDNIGGATTMVEHLIRLGHRRIAHFAGDPAVSGGLARVEGYKKALEAAGIEIDPNLVLPGAFTQDSGAERAMEMLRRRAVAPLPTAIFCANDAIASGVIGTLRDHGVDVPREVSVAGFDDSVVARLSRMGITTVRQPLGTMGAAATEMLLEQIDSSRPEPGAAMKGRKPGDTLRSLLASGAVLENTDQSVIFRCTLVERESVGPAPGR